MTPSRREAIGALGTLAAVGGWIGLSADELAAQTGGAASTKVGGAVEYTLPKLPYDYADLEPHIDAQTMTLHHTKHHNAYVEGLNKSLAALAEMRKSANPDDAAKVRDLTDALAFNGSGHVLHTVFWSNMKKNGGGEPSGALASVIARDFGTFAAFQAHFYAASVRVQGSGWGILAWEPLGRQLIVLSAEKHQNQAMFGCVPLLALDVWEHAYYLKYQNKRADYIKAFWNVVNWDNVAERLAIAQKLTP